MTSFAQLWKMIENLNEAQRSDVCNYIWTFVDHQRAKKRVIEEIVARLVGKPTPIAVMKAVETAIDRKHQEWKEIAEAPVMAERRLAEHKKERHRLAETLVRSRKRIKELRKEIAALNKQAALARSDASIASVCSFPMPSVPDAKLTAAEWGVLSEPFAGVYFAFSDGIIQYVGESCNVPQRLRSHGTVKPDWMVGVIKLEPHERFFAEAYYIWLMKPPLNREGSKTRREMPIR